MSDYMSQACSRIDTKILQCNEFSVAWGDVSWAHGISLNHCNKIITNFMIDAIITLLHHHFMTLNI